MKLIPLELTDELDLALKAARDRIKDKEKLEDLVKQLEKVLRAREGAEQQTLARQPENHRKPCESWIQYLRGTLEHLAHAGVIPYLFVDTVPNAPELTLQQFGEALSLYLGKQLFNGRSVKPSVPEAALGNYARRTYVKVEASAVKDTGSAAEEIGASDESILDAVAGLGVTGEAAKTGETSQEYEVLKSTKGRETYLWRPKGSQAAYRVGDKLPSSFQRKEESPEPRPVPQPQLGKSGSSSTLDVEKSQTVALEGADLPHVYEKPPRKEQKV
ncbi:hypothetical protein HYS48_03100 [Candidatus Woesearchaeota archaeon]|nr:hypothetical protein [Candidatus Woesearchaeota archaeon]